MQPDSRLIDIGIRIHVLEWKPLKEETPKKSAFLLIHGLSSNAHTWEQVGAQLAAAGHAAIAIDLRGHGLSEKPDTGYEFQPVISDIDLITRNIGWDKPIMAGQSWGGNVLLEYAARYPQKAAGFIFVDGGFLDLKTRGPWEETSQELRPPDLTGRSRFEIENRIRQSNPGWSSAAIENTLGNFEIRPDQTVKPWLSLENHMAILRAMYDQEPQSLYPRVKEPVLICAAENHGEQMEAKKRMIQAAVKGLSQADVTWFPGSAHDIHVDQPEKLAAAMLSFSASII